MQGGDEQGSMQDNPRSAREPWARERGDATSDNLSRATSDSQLMRLVEGLLDVTRLPRERIQIERQGAEIVIRVPLEHLEAEDGRAGRAGARGRRTRVLIIEDNVDAAETLREILEMGGHDVHVAYNGVDGLALARATRPDIVLCDIGLPGLDGFGVARALRADETLARTFLVAVTGYSLPEDRRRSAEAGFDRHLSKPPRLTTLEALIIAAGAASKDRP